MRLGELTGLAIANAQARARPVNDALAGIFRGDLREAGLVHNVGTIDVPDRILFTPGRLTRDECRTLPVASRGPAEPTRASPRPPRRAPPAGGR